MRSTREIPETHEIRGFRIRLYPDDRQMEVLRQMQEEMRRAWNLLVGWRRAHTDACVRRAERDNVIGTAPARPEPAPRPQQTAETEEAWRLYRQAMAERRLAAIKYCVEGAQAGTVPGYDWMPLSTNAWEYQALRQFTCAPRFDDEGQVDRSGIESICSANQYQALIYNFKRATRPLPRSDKDPMPLMVRSGVCFGLLRSVDRLAEDLEQTGSHQRSASFYDCWVKLGAPRLKRIKGRTQRPRRNPSTHEREYLPISDSVLQGVAIRHETDGWYAAIRCVVPKRKVTPWSKDDVVGVALGLEYLVACSDGTLFKNPVGGREARLLADRQSQEHARREGVDSCDDEPRTRVHAERRGAHHSAHESSARGATRQSRRVKDYVYAEIIPYLRQFREIVIGVDSESGVASVIKGPQSRLTQNDRGGYRSAAGLIIEVLRQRHPDQLHEQVWDFVSQDCSECGERRPATWGKWKEDPVSQCPKCGFSCHRRVNAARNLRRKYLASHLRTDSTE